MLPLLTLTNNAEFIVKKPSAVRFIFGALVGTKVSLSEIKSVK